MATIAAGILTPGKDYFTNLPVELLEMICQDLDLFSRLELRRVFPKNCSKIVTKLLGKAVQTVYVSPAKISVRHFQGICQSEYLRHLVKQVMFVPQSLHRFGYSGEPNEMNLKEYREESPELSALEAEVSFSLYRRVIRELKAHYFDLSETHDAYRSFEEKISISLSSALQEGIKRLPAVRSIGIADHIDQEGMNSSWGLLSSPLRATLAARRPHASATAMAAVEDSILDVLSINLVNTFLHAVHQAAPRIESFFLGRSHDSQLPFRIEYPAAINVNRLGFLLRNIVKFEVSCADCEEQEFYEDCPEWVHIARSMPKLQVLKVWLGVDPGLEMWINPMAGCRVIDHFLESYTIMPGGCYTELKTFEVLGTPTAMTVINAKKLHKILSDHAATLEEVKLKNVCVVDNLSVDEEGMPSVKDYEVDFKMRQSLEKIRPLTSKMKRFEMLKSRDGEEWYDYAKDEALGERSLEERARSTLGGE